MYRRRLKHSPVKNLFRFASSKTKSVLTVESALEFDTCFHLEYSPEITTFEAQPEGLYYSFEGKCCPYTPDFKVHYLFYRGKSRAFAHHHRYSLGMCN